MEAQQWVTEATCMKCPLILIELQLFPLTQEPDPVLQLPQAALTENSTWNQTPDKNFPKSQN